MFHKAFTLTEAQLCTFELDSVLSGIEEFVKEHSSTSINSPIKQNSSNLSVEIQNYSEYLINALAGEIPFSAEEFFSWTGKQLLMSIGVACSMNRQIFMDAYIKEIMGKFQSYHRKAIEQCYGDINEMCSSESVFPIVSTKNEFEMIQKGKHQ